MKRILAPAIVAAVVLAGCESDSHAGDGTSGIHGTTSVGPQCPVEIEGSPCPNLPFDGMIRVTTSNGDVAAEVHTVSDGSFDVPLEPGTYTVVAVTESEGGPPSAVPQTVDVTAGRYVEVALEIDTGIR